MNERKKQIIREVEELQEEITVISNVIHENPELGFEEYKASQLLTTFLEKHGFSVERGCAGMETSFRAEKKGSRDGPVVGLLCEYDALPGIGHACGHNIIAASAVGAAVGTAGLLEEGGGSIVVLGTPAEEGSGGGKVKLFQAGVMDDIDCAMMFHPGPLTVVKDKTLAIQALEFTFHGVAAHGGAAQETGRNALEATIQTFNGINSLRGHLKKEVNIHGIIKEGGIASNIIPDKAVAVFGVRAKTRSQLEEVVERVSNCALGAALMTGCTVDIQKIGIGYDDMVANDTLLALIADNLNLLQIPIDRMEAPEGLASTDVGNLSHKIPAVQAMIGIGDSALPHTPPFAQICGGENGVKIAMKAAKALALTVADLLLNPELVERAKAELEDKRDRGEA